jgi:hypothetical protein
MEIDYMTDWSGSAVLSEMEKVRQKWAAHGHKLPRLVYWNVDARSNTILDKGDNVSFVSGMSPSIFKQVITGKSGIDLLLDTLLDDSVELVGFLDVCVLHFLLLIVFKQCTKNCTYGNFVQCSLDDEVWTLALSTERILLEVSTKEMTGSECAPYSHIVIVYSVIDDIEQRIPTTVSVSDEFYTNASHIDFLRKSVFLSFKGSDIVVYCFLKQADCLLVINLTHLFLSL